AAPACVITTSESAASFAAGSHVLLLDDRASLSEVPEASVRNPVDADRVSPVRPEHAAYVMYTSGSTGNPKGVLVERRALTRFLEGMRGAVSFAPDDRHIAVTPPSFDISVVELLLPLCCGAKVVIAD